MPIDWDKSVGTLDSSAFNAQGKSVLEPGGPQETYVMTDQGLAPAGQYSPLPEIGGLLGGLGGAYLAKSPTGAELGAVGGRAAGTALLRSLFPSLAGSTVGTGVGLGAEAYLQGGTTPGRVLGSLAENAAWDVGGNLVFSVGGKVIKLGKEALDAAGITKASAFGDAQIAAQKFLSDRGATLTRGQLTGKNLDLFLEEISKGGTGASAFRQQQEKVGEALTKGTQEVLNTLDTSDAFKSALKANEPLSRAAGENFQNLINTARTAFKDKFRPFYDSLSNNYGIYVDMRPVKQAAEQELERLARIKNAGAAADRKAVLDQIVKQDDFVEFGAAHDLRSAFSGAASDLKVPGAGTTSKGAAYSKYASDIENQMDSAMQMVGLSKKSVEQAGYTAKVTPATGETAITTGTTGFNPATVKTEEAKALLQQYKETQNAYKLGQQGLFNATINQAMKEAPSKAGAYLFDLSQTEKSTDLFKAISEADKYAKGSSQILGDFKYGFLNQAMSSPENIKGFAEKITKGSSKYDPEMEKSFFKLFKNEAQPLREIFNAADVGLESQKSGIAAFLRNKATITGGQALTGVGGYLLLPEDMKDKINLPETLIAAGGFILTPRLIAKAMTNKEAVSALAELARVQNNPKFAGAAAAKLADRLNSSGIIDSEYIKEVNNIFQQTPQNQQQTAPVTPGTVNWDKAVQ